MSYLLIPILYGLAAFCWAAAMLPERFGYLAARSHLRWAGFFLNLLGLAAAGYYVATLWIETGHPPFRTLQQSLVVFTITTTLAWALTMRELPVAGLAAAAFNLLMAGYGATRGDSNVHEMPPALQSAWFIPHVVIYFAGYAALFFSFVTSVLYFATDGKNVAAEGKVDFARWTHMLILFGFSMLSVGLILGAFWAKVAWGDWWTWDPKENWALISWLLYGAWLHMRRVEGVSRRAMVILAVVGFFAVLFTYLGVNYLPAAQNTLHSYTMN